MLFLQVVITDLGELGENAIVVFEEAVGVGAEETVIGGVDDLDSVYLESDSDVLQVGICIYLRYSVIILKLPRYKLKSFKFLFFLKMN